jgi:hypothetical protein
MTTQPTTSTEDWHLPSEFSMEHTPLYGILVTEKSFLIGTRSQVQKHHAHFLSHRIAATGLPPELCDEIGGHLLTLLQKDSTQLWKKMAHDPVAREARFSLGCNFFNAESKLALRKFYDRITRCETTDGTANIRCVDVFVDDADGADGEVRRYVHISASMIKPSMCVMVPGEASSSGGPELSFRNGRVKVSNQPDGDSEPSWDAVRVFMSTGEAGRASRLVQYDDLDASIRGWNQKLIEVFVSGLGLKVAGVRGEEGIQPKFRMLQQMAWLTRRRS